MMMNIEMTSEIEIELEIKTGLRHVFNRTLFKRDDHVHDHDDDDGDDQIIFIVKMVIVKITMIVITCPREQL